jgi:hypothetical protein
MERPPPPSQKKKKKKEKRVVHSDTTIIGEIPLQVNDPISELTTI